MQEEMDFDNNPLPPVEEVDPLLEGLTAPQVEAVTHVDGPMLVLAGAGSGKTRTITRRIAYLVQRCDIAPWNVLAITFTNKAAGEMRERVGQLLTERQANAVMIGTFHSLCSRILRKYATTLNLSPSFTIYDTSDQTRAMKQALSDLNMNSNHFPPGKMLHTISGAKNELIGPEEFAKSAHDFFSKKAAAAYEKYQAILTKNKALDFDDLILQTVKLMKFFPAALDELQERFKYILIDEYQDTNHAQFILAHSLAHKHGNLNVTGDPDQSIYGWRGANIKNILEFEQYYPKAKIVKLEQNYRSTQLILAAADHLIQNNAERKHKALWTENEKGAPIRCFACSDERHEAKVVVDEFEKLKVELGLSWSDFAVFYRTNSLSRVIEDQLRNRAIPYQIARGTAFFDRKEIKDACAYLRAIVNPDDEVNLLRIVNMPPRGISDATVKALQVHSVASHIPVYELMRQAEVVASLNSRAVNSVKKFAALLDQWRMTLEQGTCEESLRQYVENILRESGLEERYRNDNSDPDGDRIENLGELISSVQQFENDQVTDFDAQTTEVSGLSLMDKMLAYLEQVALVSDTDSIEQDEGCVTLMTLHAAKGLEFPVVAMLGLEDGLLPHERSLQERTIEEERRLCFVGITRAMRVLLLTNARFRTVFGKSSSTIPSRFLTELPRELMQTNNVADQGDRVGSFGGGVKSESNDPLLEEYPPGTMVRHPQFGFGKVIQVRSSGAHTRATIGFERAGVKTLILQYARLEIVDF
ncbi:MAG: ATP-dependent helicase [Phycisphaeraceae bacterium JB051]